ncbi:hypothetical protein ABWH92_01245 [Ahrensia marina]|uniref:hypothetical protein n=1 Tax=Ahrensia marina TaxID=1514904 RepID=UPI0035D0A75A
MAAQMHRFSVTIAHHFYFRRYRSLFQCTNEIVTRYRTIGGLTHRYQVYKLIELQRILEEHQPERILELGAGTTTALLAIYVKQSKHRALTTIDESDKWLEQAKKLAGIVDFDKQFQMISTDAVADIKIPAVRYAKVPIEAYDLVLIDGPSLRIDGNQRKDAINDNIFDLIEQFPPQTIVVDGRFSTVTAIEKHYNKFYQALPSQVRRSILPLNYRYFSIFDKTQ